MLAKKIRFVGALLLLLALAVAWGLHAAQILAWPLALLAGLVFLMVFLACTTALTFLLSGLYSSPRPAHFRLSLAGKLKTWFDEYLATLHTFFWRQAFFGNKALASGDDSQKPALLLIHGFLCNRAYWTGFARHFAAQGHVIESVNLEPTFGSIDEYPAIVHDALQTLKARTGQSKVVMIGHSMGGLVIRAYLRDYGSQSLRKAITLGTPHVGTWGAQLGQGRNASQMRLNTHAKPNGWLSHVRHLESPEQDQLFEVLLTHHDNIVFPQAIQTLGQAPVHEFGGMGHVRMVYAASVRAKVREILARC